jgi:hypothetical protein
VSAALLLVALAACSDDDSIAPPAARVLTTVTVSVPGASIEVGQMAGATAAGFDQKGEPIAIGPVTWTSETPTIAAVVQTTGFIFGIAEGTTRITAMVDGKVGERTVTVAKAASIRINEIQPRADQPTGWLEFFNPTAATVDVSDWTIVDNDFFGTPYRFPAGSTIPAGGFLVVEEANLPFGLDATDSAHLFSKFGVQVDAAAWATQPATTYGRCPNQAAPIVTTAPTKGQANACPQ